MHTGVHSKFKDVFHFKESCLCNAQTFSSIFKTNVRPSNVIFTSSYLFWFCVCIARRFYYCTYGLYAFKPKKLVGGIYHDFNFKVFHGNFVILYPVTKFKFRYTLRTVWLDTCYYNDIFRFK